MWLTVISAASSCFFGIVGLLTKATRDDGGVTRWGWVSMAGFGLGMAVAIVSVALDVRQRTHETQLELGRISSELAFQKETLSLLRRNLNRLGKVRFRLGITIPGSRFPNYRRRILAKYPSWGGIGAMPIVLDRDGPSAARDEMAAYHFLEVIMISIAVDDPSTDSPEFLYLLVASPKVTSKLPVDNGITEGISRPATSPKPDRFDLFYDHEEDMFYVVLETGFTENYQVNNKFLSYLDFAGKEARLAFNVSVLDGTYKPTFSVGWLEVALPDGRRTLVKDFRSASGEHDTFVSQVPKDAFR